MKSLYDFQRIGAEWLRARHGALLADEPGLGKTATALAALPSFPAVLVVAPAIAKGVWAREANYWRPDLSVSILEGELSFRWPKHGEIIITGYHILPGDPKNFWRERVVAPEGCLPGTILIGDEAHTVRRSSALCTKRFKAISNSVKLNNGNVWLLTATPLVEKPLDLWTVFGIAGIAEEAFSDWNNFCRLFDAGKGRFGIQWGSPSDEVPGLIGKVLLRRRRVDVLPQLPEKSFQVHDINVSSLELKRICDRAIRVLSAAGINIDHVGSIDEVIERCNDRLVFDEIAKARAALAIAKIPAMEELTEIFESSGEPIVVFSAHRAPIDVFTNRPGWRVIHGGVNSRERSEIEDEFQAGNLRGVAMTIEAGGVAITLTKAAHAIFVDETWTPALNEQAQDRLVRIGQTRGVVIHRLVARHALDIRLASILSMKSGYICGSVDAASIDKRRGPLLDKERMALRLIEDLVFSRGVEVSSVDVELVANMYEQISTGGMTDSFWLSAIQLHGKYNVAGGVDTIKTIHK